MFQPDSRGWHYNHQGDLQITYEDPTGKEQFVVRSVSDYKWVAINLSVGKYGCGLILAEGQSDTDVLRKTLECFLLMGHTGEAIECPLGGECQIATGINSKEVG